MTMRLPDLNSPYTMFVPNKKNSNYKSECPYNKGYYLDGGCGGVKCSNCASILPGHTWYSTCQKDYKNCKFYTAPEEPEETVQLVMFA